LATFTGDGRLQRIRGCPFGLCNSDLAAYYAMTAPTAALGPISPEEELAQQQARDQRHGSQQQTPSLLSGGIFGNGSGSGDGGLACGTNPVCEVWLTNIVVSQDEQSNWTATLTVAGGDSNAGAVYDLLCCTNTSGGPSITNWGWVWLGKVAACDTLTLTNQPGYAALYLLGTPFDSDGDGIPDAMESLIYHTDPHDPNSGSPDSNGNGIPDWLEIQMGFNPAQPNTLGRSSAGYTLFLAHPAGHSQIP
jgi:hypothetical protein